MERNDICQFQFDIYKRCKNEKKGKKRETFLNENDLNQYQNFSFKDDKEIPC